MSTKIQVRRGTAAQWTSANPTLDAGEIGLETDTGKVKIGNVRNITQTVVTGGTNVVYTTGVAHGLVALDYVNITGITTAQGLPASNPVQITAVTSTTFTVNVTTGTTGTYTSLSGNATSPWNSLIYLTDHSDFVGVLTGAKGGTGVNNSGNTITLCGNLITSGATTIGSSTHTVALNTGNNTSITLPTTGTLATLAGSEVLSGKTYNGLTLTANTTGFSVAGGSVTSKTLTVNNAYTLTGSDATVSLAGNLTTSAALTTTGANALTLATGASVTVATIPAGTVTLADLGTAQTFSAQKTLTTPLIANSSGTAASGLVDYNGEVFRLTNTNTTAAKASIFAPYWVVSSTDSSAITSTTAVNMFTTNQQTLTLEGNKAYYFKLMLYCVHTFTSGTPTFNLIANFSQTPQSISYMVAYHGSAGTTAFATQRTVATTSAITPSITATTNSTIIIQGTFLSNATPGTLGFQGAGSTTGVSTLVKAGSQMQIMKIGTSATGAISGTFA